MHVAFMTSNVSPTSVDAETIGNRLRPDLQLWDREITSGIASKLLLAPMTDLTSIGQYSSCTWFEECSLGAPQNKEFERRKTHI